MDALSPAFVGVLRCPVTRSPLRWIPCGLWIGEGGSCLGPILEKTVGWDGGLLREDGKGMYPVRGGIPVLLAEEFVEIPEGMRAVFAGGAGR